MNISYKTCAALGGLALLVACNSDGTIGERGSVAWYSWSTPEEKKVYFTEVCSDYGFEQNTPEFAQCLAAENRAMAAQRSNAMSTAAAMGPRTCSTVGGITNCF